MELISKALTHGGKFHADDVFSAALLTILNPEITITRAFSVPADYDGLVFDLGGGAYDHHHAGAELRENGVPYAAFGLLWRAFGSELLDTADAARFDEKFVQPLDLDDNTGCGDAVASLIAQFNPGWDSEALPDDRFVTAGLFAQIILTNQFQSLQGIGRARALIEDALTRIEDGIVVLDRFAPWRMTLAPSEAQFVVYPSNRGGFSAQGVPYDANGSEVLKCPFPAAWAGRSAAELQQMSGLATLRFCHNSRFLISADTREDAIAACRLAQQEK